MNALKKWCVGVLAAGAVAFGVAGCAEEEDFESLGMRQDAVKAPLGARPCTITVTGKGAKDIEEDYLPRVVTCENGGADLEALKAQAIAARSVAYYAIATSGSICDGQGCQVYGCGRAPSETAKRAVRETAGVYLSYNAMLTYGFYVAGDSSPNSSCVGDAGSTEKWVTYNNGKSGTTVTQTRLGWVGPPGFGQNRGCMSQWGARCLEGKGKDYQDILKFYYGTDIQLLTRSGTCGGSTTTPTPTTTGTPTSTPTSTPRPSECSSTPASGSGLQPITRDEIIANAAGAMGYSYWWGGGAWDPNSRSYPGSCSGSCPSCSHSATRGGPEYGADCSGMVAKAWQVPAPTAFKTKSHPYGTVHFKGNQTHWKRIARSELKAGDALVYNNGRAGHIVIFERWAANGQAMQYECAGCSVGCVHRPKSIGSEYIAIRRNLVEDSCEQKETPKKNQPPKATLVKATGDALTGTASDPDAPKTGITILVTFDAPRGSPTTKTAHGTSKDGKFSVTVPDALKDGKRHTVYVYAIDSSDPKLIVQAVGAPTTITTVKPPADPAACKLAAGPMPAEFTCGAAKWGDCKCDCNCGAVDGDCMPGECSGCDHDVCTDGGPLAPTCTLDGQGGACIKAICKADPYCCEQAWTLSCMMHIETGDVAGCTKRACQ